MGLFEQFPFTNYQQLNLDWVITKIKENEYNIKKINIEKNAPVYSTVCDMVNDNSNNFNSCVCLKYSDKNNDVHISTWQKTLENENGITILKGKKNNWKIYGEVDVLSITDKIIDYSDIINHAYSFSELFFLPLLRQFLLYILLIDLLS